MDYHLKTRMTEADWDAVEDANPLAAKMRTAQRKIEAVLRGDQAAAYLCGGAGVGKTHIINATINATGITPIRISTDSYRDVIRAFEESRGRTPIIFEECDQMFRSERTLNILKLATDAAGARKMQVWVPPARKGEDGYFKTISCTNPLLFAMNGNINDINAFPRILQPHLQALIDREKPLVIDAAKEAWWEYSVFLALRRGLLRQSEDRRHDIPLALQNAAIRWFSANAWNMAHPSPRTLKKIAGVFLADHAAKKRAEQGQRYDPRALGDDLEQFLVDVSDRSTRIAPFAPDLFVTPRPPKKERMTQAASLAA